MSKNNKPLKLVERPKPKPQDDEILIKVTVCGVCYTEIDAIIDTTPVWKPVVEALKNLDAAGRLVINAIRKENYDIDYLQHLDYPTHLWLEKEIKSVANVERKDVSEFLDLAARIPIKPEYVEYPLTQANEALMEIKQRKIRGTKVLRMDTN